MSPSTKVTEAFILRTVNYRDSDRILTLLTRDLGKISAIARWARSSRKRFGGALEPFALLEVSLGRGRGHDKMFLLTEASLVDSHPGLATDLDRIGCAALVTELVRELTPDNDPDPRIFDLLREFMSLMSAPKTVSVRGLALCAKLRVLALCGVAVGIGLDDLVLALLPLACNDEATGPEPTIYGSWVRDITDAVGVPFAAEMRFNTDDSYDFILLTSAPGHADGQAHPHRGSPGRTVRRRRHFGRVVPSEEWRRGRQRADRLD